MGSFSRIPAWVFNPETEVKAARMHTRPRINISIGTIALLELQHGDDPLMLKLLTTPVGETAMATASSMTTPLGYSSYSPETPTVVAATRAPSVRMGCQRDD
ncbi:hypothetical protein PIB30_064124 [Stylosanthes scabra]|uniref:Uncharacterized protein n=1 Tax=Stylosanthes scabra TaxID=79078 RepID=A0ABU6VLD4_9FABA|nr:hypothetical protein [Stylosanthes scabra]